MSLRLRGAAVLLFGIGAWAADEPPDVFVMDMACMIHYGKHVGGLEREIALAEIFASQCRMSRSCARAAREILPTMREARDKMADVMMDLARNTSDDQGELPLCDLAVGHMADAVSRYDVQVRDLEALAR